MPGLFVLGDFNRDGKVTAADIQAMLVALTDLNAYQLVYGLTDAALVLLGDLNGDHAVTNADIQPLLDLLAGAAAARLACQNRPVCCWPSAVSWVWFCVPAAVDTGRWPERSQSCVPF